MKTTKTKEQPAAKAKGRKAPAVVDEEALLSEIMTDQERTRPRP